jgi:hypothetical protein
MMADITDIFSDAGLRMKNTSASEARAQGEGHTESANGTSRYPNAWLLRPCKKEEVE